MITYKIGWNKGLRDSTLCQVVINEPRSIRERWVGIALLIPLALLLSGCVGYPGLPFGYTGLFNPFAIFGPMFAALQLFLVISGLALLLAGWKIHKLMVVVSGFLLGAGVGVLLAAGSGRSGVSPDVGLVLGGLVGAGLAWLLYYPSVFLTGAAFGAFVLNGIYSALFRTPPSTPILVVGGVIGGVALLVLIRPYIVIVTSAVGAVMFGLGIGADLGLMFLFFLIGVAVQYAWMRGLIGKVSPQPVSSVQSQAIQPLVIAAPPEGAASVSPQVRPDVPPAPAALSPTATLISGDGSSNIVIDGYVIGRGSGCDLQLPDSAVSRQHARIRHASGSWFIQDAGSSGGTIVNGQRVEATRLNHGDRIGIGNTTFVFHLEV